MPSQHKQTCGMDMSLFFCFTWYFALINLIILKLKLFCAKASLSLLLILLDLSEWDLHHDRDRDGNPECRCVPGFTPAPDTITGCKPECVIDPDCRMGFVCRANRCAAKPDPCQPNPCGPGAQCNVNPAGESSVPIKYVVLAPTGALVVVAIYVCRPVSCKRPVFELSLSCL